MQIKVCSTFCMHGCEICFCTLQARQAVLWISWGLGKNIIDLWVRVAKKILRRIYNIWFLLKKYRFLWSNGRFKALPFYDKFRQDFSPCVIDSLASTTKISWNMNFIQHRCQWNKDLTFKFKAFCSQNRSQLFDIPKILNSNYVY